MIVIICHYLIIFHHIATAVTLFSRISLFEEAKIPLETKLSHQLMGLPGVTVGGFGPDQADDRDPRPERLERYKKGQLWKSKFAPIFVSITSSTSHWEYIQKLDVK